MSEARPGQHVPSPPWPEEAPPFTPPAPPPPAPDDSTLVTADPESPGSHGDFPPLDPTSAGEPGPSFGSRPSFADRWSPRDFKPTAVRGAQTLAGHAERLLERPGSFAAWSILLAIATYWLGSAIGGFAHGSTFRDTFTHTAAYSGLTARQRLDAFFGVGNYVIALALLLALGLALLVPAKDERRPAEGGPGASGPLQTTRRGDLAEPDRGERASQRLLLVLTLAGLIVAFAAVVLFIGDLSHAASEPDASLQGAVADLAAIPMALVASLWAASRVNEWPQWARIAPADPAHGAGGGQPDPGGFSARHRPVSTPGPDLAGPPPSPPGNHEGPDLPG
ncbi:MAG: hypothetical protein FWC87_01340 [Acidimicrobiaceae bacterium]|nr:hypothetical protein [Acidimicrobiaceae bacterium]